MTELLNSENIKNNITKENVYGKKYQYAYIELTVVRTLARCGGKEGLQRLAEYLDDIHYILSSNAHSELVNICKVDFEYDIFKWYKWIANRYSITITPYIYD